MVVMSSKFSLMDCYGRCILVKMCYAIVRKRIFAMTFTVLLEHIKEKVYVENLQKTLVSMATGRLSL